MQQVQQPDTQVGCPPQDLKTKLFWAFVLIKLTYITMVLSGLACLTIAFIAGILILALIRNHTVSFHGYVIIILFGIGGLIGFFATLRGLIAIFIRPKGYHPAYRISTSSETELNRFIMDICLKVGAKPPNTVLMLAEPGAFVSDSEMRVMNGVTTGRILAIGLPLLYVLSKNELRAILAHEFAHFVGEDIETGKKFAAAFQGILSAHEMLDDSIMERKSLALKLPLYLPRAILRTCLVKLMTVTAAVEKSQEFRADWIAAEQCGGQAFGSALIKTSELSDSFFESDTIDTTDARAMHNQIGYYRAFRESVSHLTSVSHDLNQDLDDNSNVFASHPSLKARVHNTRHLPDRYNNHEPALLLVTNLAEYESAMDKLKESYEKLRQIPEPNMNS